MARRDGIHVFVFICGAPKLFIGLSSIKPATVTPGHALGICKSYQFRSIVASNGLASGELPFAFSGTHPYPSQEGNGQDADERVLPSWEGSGVGRFVESLH